MLADNKNVRFDLKWSIKKKAHVYSSGAKYCDLCLMEKNIIMLTKTVRTEILQMCPHIWKFTLGMVFGQTLTYSLTFLDIRLDRQSDCLLLLN